jgi:hypothetical protein
METPLQRVLRLARELEEAERELLAEVEAHNREQRRRAGPAGAGTTRFGARVARPQAVDSAQ